MIIGGGTAKEIKFICLDCKKSIATDVLSYGFLLLPIPMVLDQKINQNIPISSRVKKEKDLCSHRLINFEQYVGDYEKKEFENIFSRT